MKINFNTYTKMVLPIFFLGMIFSTTISYAQELDVEGNGGQTFALRNAEGVTNTLWQAFYPDEAASYKAFLQSWNTGQFDVAAVGGDMRFYTGSSYKMTLKDSGRLGLGTTSPDAAVEISFNSSSGVAGVPQLDVHETSASDFSRIKFTNTGTDFWTLAGAGGSTDKFNIYYHNGTTGSNRISVDATDGTTILGAENNGTIAALKVIAGSQELLMDGNELDSNDGLFFNHNSGNSVNMRTNVIRADVNMKHRSSSGAIYGLAIENEGANNNWWTFYTVNSNGDLELYYEGVKVGEFDPSSGVYNATSDRNRKKDIREMNNVLSKVMNLEPSVYKFIGDEKNSDHLGFIAQDIEKYFPEVVKAGKVGDTDEDLYTMDYSALGVIAISAVQEQQEMIVDQKAEIDELKAIIDQLVERVSALEKK